MHTVKIQPQEISTVCDFVKESCGISLDASKDYLIESRLSELCVSNSADSYAALVARARGNLSLASDIVDAMTTNETMFFRDRSPFDALEHKVLPELIDSKAGTSQASRLRIWSAACSTGQEAYSIAMTLCSLIHDIENWDIQIHGSDVSGQAVRRARQGLYSPLEVERGLSPDLLRNNFSENEKGWQVSEKLRSMCRFEERDLTKPLLGIGPFDIVFCRNVAIYFTGSDRRQLFERITRVMNRDGYLFVGSSENLEDVGLTPHRHCRSVFYRPAV